MFSVTFLWAEDSAISLPDVFVTAKSGLSLDTGKKPTWNVSPEWSMNWTISTSTKNQDYEKKLLDKVTLIPPLNPSLFNEADVILGLPTLLGFNLYHGYEWSGHPYFLTLERIDGDKTYQNYSQERAHYFATTALDDYTVLNIAYQDHNLGLSQARDVEVGIKSLWNNVPLIYRGKLYSANSNLGNPAASIMKNDLNLEVGNIPIFGQSYYSAINLSLLNSMSNGYVDLRMTSEKNYLLLDQMHDAKIGLGFWTNSGLANLDLLLQDQVEWALTTNVNAKLLTGLSTEVLDLSTMLNQDFAEWNDGVLLPNQKLSVGLHVNNYFSQAEESFIDIENYANRQTWDDPNNNHYYTLENFHDILDCHIGVNWDEIKVNNDKLRLRAQLAFYNKPLPNPEDHILDATYIKFLWGGNFAASLYALGRELTKSSGVYKDGYLNMDLKYDYTINSDITAGAEIRNLLSSGCEKYGGQTFEQPMLMLELRMIF